LAENAGILTQTDNKLLSVNVKNVEHTKNAGRTNPMTEPYLAKVTVNIGVGEGGEKLQKAMKVIHLVTGKKPLQNKAKVDVREWGVRKGTPLACKVTLRGDDAKALLKRAFWIRNNKMPAYSFDNHGNVAFGIPDYTNFQGMKYDATIGTFGMDICITIEKPGYRIKRRSLLTKKVPKHHIVTSQEAMDLLKKEFGVEII